jgi:hypothetical protein
MLLLHSCNSLMFYHTLQGFMGAGATRLIPGTEKWGGYKEDCSLWDVFLSASRTSEASTQVDFGGGGAGRRCLVPKWTDSPKRLLGFVRVTWQLAASSFAGTFKQSCEGLLAVSSTNARVWNTSPVIEETRFKTNLTHLAIDSEVRSSVIDTPSPIISRSGTW